MTMGLYNPGYAMEESHNGALFTVELGTLVENGFDLGLDKYPIFDEGYREGLNQKIIDHYYFQEIGFETPGLFKRFLMRRMNEIMPMYNQLYLSTLIEFDPLVTNEIVTKAREVYDRSIHEDESRDSETRSHDHAIQQATSQNEATSDSDGKSKNRTLVNTTPQMQLSGHDDYASNITDTVNESTTHGESTGDTKTQGENTEETKTDGYTDTTTERSERYLDKNKASQRGIMGTNYSRLLLEYRNTFLNIDMDVIDELAPLFMSVWSNYMNLL